MESRPSMARVRSLKQTSLQAAHSKLSHSTFQHLYSQLLCCLCLHLLASPEHQQHWIRDLTKMRYGDMGKKEYEAQLVKTICPTWQKNSYPLVSGVFPNWQAELAQHLLVCPIPGQPQVLESLQAAHKLWPMEQTLSTFCNLDNQRSCCLW